MRSVVHPGPAEAPRICCAAADGAPIEGVLAAGIPLEDAVAKMCSAWDSAWLEIEAADVCELAYVIPAHAPDESHVAWYSQTYGFGAGRIDRLGMIVGRHKGASFLHGHGLWTPQGGAQAMGHILAPRTVLAAPVRARGIGLRGAGFDRRPDPETNFDLFEVAGRLGDGSYAAVRLKPNQDFIIALSAACRSLGWSAAQVHGIGSLIGARFEDGRELESLPTEFLIRTARAKVDGSEADIEIVGTDGGAGLSGRLAAGHNAVLITAELVLRRLDA